MKLIYCVCIVSSELNDEDLFAADILTIKLLKLLLKLFIKCIIIIIISATNIR